MSYHCPEIILPPGSSHEDQVEHEDRGIPKPPELSLTGWALTTAVKRWYEDQQRAEAEDMLQQNDVRDERKAVLRTTISNIRFERDQELIEEDERAEVIRNPLRDAEQEQILQEAINDARNVDADTLRIQKERLREYREGKAKRDAMEHVPCVAKQRAEGLKAQMNDIFHHIKEGVKLMDVDETMPSDMFVAGHIPGLGDRVSGFALLPHQRENVGRMLSYLRDRHGVVLADPMGMGKTLTVITFLQMQKLAALQDDQQIKPRKPFLIVVTKPCMTQWQDQLHKYAPGLKVFTLHAEADGMYASADQLRQYDVVLTTYDALLGQWQSLNELQVHFNYARSQLTEMRQTQLRVELAALKNEKERKRKSKHLLSKSVAKPSRGIFPLYAIQWSFAVFDEAHNMRNITSKRLTSALDLQVDKKVLVTGTPMQNSASELLPIFLLCDLRPFCNSDVFKAFYSPGKGAMSNTAEAKLIRLLLVCVNKAITIRAPRDFGSQMDVSTEQARHMRSLTIQYVVRLHSKDEATTVAAAESQWYWGDEPDQAPPANKKDSLRHLVRGRLISTHLELPNAGYSESGMPEYERYDQEKDEHYVCRMMKDGRPVWDDEALRQAAVADLRTHQAPVATSTPSLSQKAKNAECRARFRAQLEATDQSWRSIKLDQMVNTFRKLLADIDAAASEILNRADRYRFLSYQKFLIFADHLCELDAVEAALKKGLDQQYVYRLDATVSDRDIVIKAYEETDKDWRHSTYTPDPCRFMLATSKCASDGLDLQHTGHVCFISPLWNPFTMDQCIARGARIGRPFGVKVYRFLVDNTMDTAIMDMCDRKRKAVDEMSDFAAVDRHKDEINALDVHSLYDMLYNYSSRWAKIMPIKLLASV